MLGKYSVLQQISIGEKTIALCEDSEESTEAEKYYCCYLDANEILIIVSDAQKCSSYAQAVKMYGDRISEAAAEVLNEYELEAALIAETPDVQLTEANCRPITPEDCLVNRVVVIRGNRLRPEYRRPAYQLMLCTGGSGAVSNNMGRTCFGKSLITGSPLSFYRTELLGILEESQIPEWARPQVEEARSKIEKW